MINKIFLDVDGVLADWNKGAHKIHNLPYEEGVWPYELGPSGWNFNRDPKVNLTTKELFEPMDFDFWAGLDWMPDGRELFNYLHSNYGDKLFLLTSPALTCGRS